MVLKLLLRAPSTECSFENDVKMYGTQAVKVCITLAIPFENDVKMYGTQAGIRADDTR